MRIPTVPLVVFPLSGGGHAQRMGLAAHVAQMTQGQGQQDATLPAGDAIPVRPGTTAHIVAESVGGGVEQLAAQPFLDGAQME